MRSGAFKKLPGADQSHGFHGTIVDLSGRTGAVNTIPADAIGTMERSQMGDRRIILPGEAEPSLDIYETAAQAQVHKVCIRPKETTLALGRLGVVKLWPVQFVGQGRIWRKPDGSMDLKSIGTMQRQRAPWSIRIGWYLIGAPIWHLRAVYLQAKVRLWNTGAIVTK